MDDGLIATDRLNHYDFFLNTIAYSALSFSQPVLIILTAQDELV
jgi:hypothetical protein